MRMQKRVWLFLLLLLIFVEIMMWASLPQARLLLSQAQAKSTTKATTKARERENQKDELVRLGSRPPNCEHKCGGCVPCISIQVPTTTDQLRPLYANYEPEGWKCKCGSTFYNP